MPTKEDRINLICLHGQDQWTIKRLTLNLCDSLPQGICAGNTAGRSGASARACPSTVCRAGRISAATSAAYDLFKPRPR